MLLNRLLDPEINYSKIKKVSCIAKKIISILNFKRNILTWTGIQTSHLQISSLALYHSSNPSSIDDANLNLSLDGNVMQGVVDCGIGTNYYLFICLI